MPTHLTMQAQISLYSFSFVQSKTCKIIFLSFLLIGLLSFGSYAQGLQPGECGIRFTYDGNGALIKRDYLCNNTGVIYFKSIDTTRTAINDISANDIIKVDAIMPNPTSGKFTVNLSKPLINANVILVTANGSMIRRTRQTGETLQFDLSPQPAGIYFVRIEYEGRVLTFKVVKQ